MDLKDFRENVWKTIFLIGLGTKKIFLMTRSLLQSAFSKRMITHIKWFSFDRMWKHLANQKQWIELLKASRLILSKAWV